MTETQPQPKRISKRRLALGDPIQWTEAELAAMTEITPADVEAAAVAWRKHAPARFRNLLDAKTVEDGNPA